MIQIFSLLKRSIALIKEDYSITVVAAICYLFLHLVGAYFFPNAVDVESERYLIEVSYIFMLVHFVKIFTTLAVSAMIKDILDHASISIRSSIFIAIKKFYVVFILDLLLFAPLIAMLLFFSNIYIIKIVFGFVLLFFSVWSIFFPVIAVNDNLGPINVIRKLIIFFRLNKTNLLSFSTSYMFLLLISMFISLGTILIPTVGESLLLPIFQGIFVTIGVSIVYLYYIENNGFIC